MATYKKPLTLSQVVALREDDNLILVRPTPFDESIKIETAGALGPNVEIGMVVMGPASAAKSAYVVFSKYHGVTQSVGVGGEQLYLIPAKEVLMWLDPDAKENA